MSSQNIKFQVPFTTPYLCNSLLNLHFTAFFYNLGILGNKVLDNWKKFSSSSRGTMDLGWKCKIIYRAVIYTMLAAEQLGVDAIHVAAAATCFLFCTGRCVILLPISCWSRNLFLRNNCFKSNIKCPQQGDQHRSSIICIYEALKMFETLCRH